jgi:hypothetical protein
MAMLLGMPASPQVMNMVMSAADVVNEPTVPALVEQASM